MRRPWLVLFGILAGACGAGTVASPPGTSRRTEASPGVVSSNVRFDDYAGTKSCGQCHATHVASWLKSPMHNMTRIASDAATEIKGPFDGTVFRLKDDTATLETVDGVRYVTIESKQFGDGRWKVTRVIGGHHREDYAGVNVTSGATEERVLPVTYVFATKSLRYKGYSVMVKERPGLKAGSVWSETCIFCHNTPPHLSTVLGAIQGRIGGYQGEVVDPLLPASKRATYRITDPSAYRAAVDAELARIGARDTSAARDPIAATRTHFKAEHLVEVGIGCEACHLGSAEHVKDPSKKPSFEPRSSFYEVKTKTDTRAERINRVCARCHQVLFSGYDPTWEGGSRKRNPGGSHINSGEARDMMLGACVSKLSCVECHEPHARDATAALKALDASGQDALCTRCHDKYASPDALRAHTHHDPAGAGSRCIECHMPRKNMSLDGDLSRYHRIGSPTDPERVLLDRPLECALCHADKTVETLASTMEKWWKKSFERGALASLYGSLDANVMRATAERGKPHEQAVAFSVLGQTKDRAALPILRAQTDHPYPLVRGYAERAIESIEKPSR